MPKSISLNKNQLNFISIVFGNFFYYGIQYFILILFTKNYTKEEVGLYIFALAFIKPIFIPLNLQLRSLFVTETNENLKIQDYHSLRIAGNLTTVIAVFIIAFISNTDNILILILIGCIKIIESQSEMCHAIFQKKQDMVFIGVSKFINGILIITGISIGIYSGVNFENLIIIWILISLSVLLFLDIPFAKKKDENFLKIKKYFTLVKMKKIFLFAWPLLFLEIVSKYYESYPSLYVEKYFGLETLAIFGAIIYFKAIGGQILTQVINIVEPKLANFIKDNKIREFHKLILKLILFGAIVGAIIIIALYFSGEFILGFLFTPEYASYSSLLVLIAVSSAISYLYSFLSTSLTCMRKHYIKLPISILGLFFLMAITYVNKASLTIYSFVNYLIYTELLIGTLYYLAYFYFFRKIKNQSYGV